MQNHDSDINNKPTRVHTRHNQTLDVRQMGRTLLEVLMTSVKKISAQWKCCKAEAITQHGYANNLSDHRLNLRSLMTPWPLYTHTTLYTYISTYECIYCMFVNIRKCTQHFCWAWETRKARPESRSSSFNCTPTYIHTYIKVNFMRNTA